MAKTIRVLVWKDNLATNWPDGKRVDLSCEHINEGEWGVNMEGEIIPTATATVPVSEPGTQFQKDELGVPAGREYTSTTHFTDASFKACVKVKEIGTNNVYFVDKDSYDAAIDSCNGCCTPGTCVAPVAEIADVTNSAATASWAAVPRVVGYEYVLTAASEPCADPSTAGTFTEEVSIDFTGLTAETDYCFAVRSICGSGNYSDWSFGAFTTLA